MPQRPGFDVSVCLIQKYPSFCFVMVTPVSLFHFVKSAELRSKLLPPISRLFSPVNALLAVPLAVDARLLAELAVLCAADIRLSTSSGAGVQSVARLPFSSFSH